MKKNLWAKTILYVYKYLENIADAIDRMIDRQALNSFYYSSSNQTDNGVLAVSERIIELGERKKKLINIKVLADRALETCEIENAQILIEKYIDGGKSDEIALRHEMPIRTYFRRLVQAEEEFLFQLATYGYTENKITEYLKGEKWINEVYNRFLCKSAVENDEISEYQLLRAI